MTDTNASIHAQGIRDGFALIPFDLRDLTVSTVADYVSGWLIGAEAADAAAHHDRVQALLKK